MRPRALAAALSLLALSGCATSNARPEPTTPEPVLRRFVLDGIHVPAAPNDLDAGLEAVWEAMRIGDRLAARAALETVAPASRATPAGSTAEGMLLLAEGNLAAARARFQQAIEAAPDYATALYGLGFLAEAQANRIAGLDWYRQAVDADPTLSAAAVRLQVLELEQAQELIVQGTAAEAAGDDSGALAAYEAARRRGPDILEPYLRTAAIHLRGDRLDEAIETLQTARDRIGELRQILVPLGQALQEIGAYGDAYGVFQALETAVPGDPEVRRMVAAARELYFARDLPEEYQNLEQKPVIDRADLAALIAIRLEELGSRVGEPRSGVIMIDVDGSWAEDYIHQVVAWRVMEPFQNHTFGPGLEVSRAMFAEVAARIVDLIGATPPAPRVRPVDVSDAHYLRDQVLAAVGFGLLPLDRAQRFGLLDPVSGAEAAAAVERLVRLARD